MRSKRRVSARRSVSATASGWSAKRAAIASGVARTWLWLPRRRGSEASSVVCSRMATKASWSLARADVCAWTLPVATQGTPRRAASAARPRLSARSWRWKGRCSSTRKASRPKARSSRRMVGSSRTPWRAQPLRQTRPSAWASTSSRLTRGSPTTREVRVAEPRERRGPSRRGAGCSERYTRVSAWAWVSSRQRLAHPRASRTSRVRWRGSSDVSSVTVTSAPWMGRRPPRSRAACANSIEPETESWSVSASVVCPRSSAAATSSSGSEAPSRKEKAEWQWSSTYGMRTHVRMRGGRMPVSSPGALRKPPADDD